MNERTVARRYARALLDIGRERQNLDALREELNRLVKLLQENSDLHRLLAHRLIPARQKKAVIGEILPGLDPVLKNFLYLLLDKRRERYLPAIASEFSRLVDRERRVLEVEVYSAVPLPEEIQEELKTSLGVRTSQQVRLNWFIKPELIGGLVLRVGDRVWDGSIKGRLERLRERLLRGDRGEREVHLI
ncbi:MAG: F-type H+-transporting ATPase subunit delta [Clostridia bacterium]|nr:F-type H+-transporting ATPase subunit delta [Clostridia bacterium]